MRSAKLQFVGCLWAALVLSSTAIALDIQVSFDAGNSLPEDFPSYDPDASLLDGLVEYAATVYEEIIEDNHVLELSYRWDQNLAESTSVNNAKHDFGSDQSGREVSGGLRFDTDEDWYIDPTPNNDSEFNMVQWLYDYGPSQLSTAQQSNRFAGDVPALFEAGYQGEAFSTAPADAQSNFDLLTLVFHEMGHALGLSGKLDALVDETEIEAGDSTGDFDVEPNLVGGSEMAIKVRDDDDEENNYNDRAHLFGGSSGTPPGPAVITTIGRGERRRPSAADIFAMATVSNWTDLDLPRKEFLTGISWNIGGNWLGGAAPGLGDDTFLRHGGTVLLTGLGRANDLLIDDDSRLSTGANTLLVFGTATVGKFGNGELLVGGIFGPVSHAIVDAQRLVLSPNGTLRLVGSQAPGQQAVVTGTEFALDGGALIVNNDSTAHINSTIRVETATTFTIGSGAELVLNGNLTSAANLTKTGSGTLVIDGENEAWTGDLIVDLGRVNVAPGNSLGNGTTVNLRTALGVIDFASAGNVQVFGGLQGEGTVLLGSDEIWFGANHTDTVFTGAILPPLGSFGAGFVKLGTGTTTFADDALALDVSRASSREGGTLVFSGNAFVSTALLEATNGSTVRIEGDATVIATAGQFAGGQLQLVGGTFITTVFDGTIFNQGGTVSPGTATDHTRRLPMSDNFNIDANGTLQIDIGGLNSGDYDEVSLPVGPPGTGKFAGLFGTLEVNLVDGFVPNLGDTFTIVKARFVSWLGVLDAPIFNGLTFDMTVVNAGTNEMHAVLEVVEFTGQPGDYNDDGTVDAADYVLWRKNDGKTNTLPNDPIGGTIGQLQYNQWKDKFGTSAAADVFSLQPVAAPELPTGILCVMALVAYRLPRFEALRGI